MATRAMKVSYVRQFLYPVGGLIAGGHGPDNITDPSANLDQSPCRGSQANDGR